MGYIICYWEIVSKMWEEITMYRKKLMRACLAGIMAATVVTQSVPAYAAEPTKQEAAKLRTITIQYQDENGIVGTYDLYAQPEDVAAVSAIPFSS